MEKICSHMNIHIGMLLKTAECALHVLTRNIASQHQMTHEEISCPEGLVRNTYGRRIL